MVGGAGVLYESVACGIEEMSMNFGARIKGLCEETVHVGSVTHEHPVVVIEGDIHAHLLRFNVKPLHLQKTRDTRGLPENWNLLCDK